MPDSKPITPDAASADDAPSVAYLDTVLDCLDQGVLVVSPDLRILRYNERFCELMEVPPEQCQNFQDLLAFNARRGEYGEHWRHELANRLHRAKRFAALHETRKRPSGIVVEIRSNPLPGGGFVTTYTDITQNYRISSRLSFRASHDPLTELSNRHDFERRLMRLVRHTTQSSDQHALCFLDLDRFKVVNDTCGHVAGDELLRQIAGLLRGKVRRHDSVARIGGDEFAILMEHCSLAQAERVAGIVRESIEDLRFSWSGHSFPIGASVGVVPITRASTDHAQILSAADQACYAAKHAGRNRVHVLKPGQAALSTAHGEVQWIDTLKQALDGDGFVLAAQPIVPLTATAPGRHIEILVRLRGTDQHEWPPMAFFPAAERYQLAGRIDRHVIDLVIDWLNRQDLPASDLRTVAVNLCAPSLSDSGFAAALESSLERANFSLGMLCFEITETAAIGNLDQAVELIQRLRGRGCRFALDDFGSGLSSFGYLKNLPVDYLKIDGQFVRDMARDRLDYTLVKSINEIGQTMNIQTIAEHAESPEIVALLKDLGVDYAQGHALGKPVALTEFAHLAKSFEEV